MTIVTIVARRLSPALDWPVSFRQRFESSRLNVHEARVVDRQQIVDDLLAHDLLTDAGPPLLRCRLS